MTTFVEELFNTLGTALTAAAKEASEQERGTVTVDKRLFTTYLSGGTHFSSDMEKCVRLMSTGMDYNDHIKVCKIHTSRYGW